MTTQDERILLLGDIHANDTALRAVLDAYNEPMPQIWFLGDLFGRGPQPARAYRRLMRERPEAMVIGNHEGGLAGLYQNIRFADMQHGYYNNADWDVLMRHRRDLCAQGLLHCDGEAITGGEVFDLINRLPVICAPRPTIYMVHGGLQRPFAPPDSLQIFYDRLVWEYVYTEAAADYTLQAMDWVAANRPTDRRIVLSSEPAASPELVLVGHYHDRLLYDRATGELHYPPRLGHVYELGGRAVLLSPGSVGFPREKRDLDASYCVLTLRDSRPVAVEFRTVAYNRQMVRQEMRRKGYPEATIQRLRLNGESDAPVTTDQEAGS